MKVAVKTLRISESLRSKSMEQTKEQMLRTYAWSYFAFHADQRMKTFNFFLIVAGLMSSGILALLKEQASAWIITPLGIALSYLCLLFARLDVRNRNLVRNGENALKYLDSLHQHPRDKDAPHLLEVFDRDDFEQKGKSRCVFLEGHFSYSQVIRHVYVLFGIIGICLAVVPLFRKSPQTDDSQHVVVTALPPVVIAPSAGKETDPAFAPGSLNGRPAVLPTGVTPAADAAASIGGGREPTVAVSADEAVDEQRGADERRESGRINQIGQ